MRDCPKADGRCLVVFDRTGYDYTPPPERCAECNRADPPNAWNGVTVGLALYVLKKNNDPRHAASFAEWHPILYAHHLPSAMKRAAKYAKALARWTAAGMPKREPAEVERIYRDLCCRCEPNFDGKLCRLCGCKVNLHMNGTVNKIAMATEHCEIGRW